MFKFLRSQAKVFYWVIAGSFVLFLFLGGMTGRGCQAPGTKKRIEAGVIGSVNGDKITSQSFDFAVQQQLAQMRQQNRGQQLNADQIATANQQAWDALVANLIFEQAVAARKIKVSDEEVLDVFRNNPPPQILAQFRDEAGNVDMDAYYAALQNPENDWTSTENYVRTMIPRQKLNEDIGANATVSDEAVREEYIRQTGKAVAEYMGVLFAEMKDIPDPTEAEIDAWYQSHPDDFLGQEEAQVKVVRFAKTASPSDDTEVLGFLKEIREEIVAGDRDFATAATEYSDDPGSAAKGGELGSFDRTRMVAPFAEAAFALDIGEISQPVRTQFGYHLIEVTARKSDEETGEVTEVTARHILLKVTPSNDTIDIIQEAADNFRNRVDATTFESVAIADSLDLLSPPAFPAGRGIPSIPLTLRGANWAFAAEPGEISPVLSNDNCFYIILAGQHIPATIRPLDDVRSQVSLAVTKDHKATAAKALLSPAFGEVQLGTAMADVAKAHGLSYAVTDTFTANGNVDGVGYGTEFNMTMIQTPLGELVPEITTLRGVFAARALWVTAIDQADFESRANGIHAALLQQAQGELLNDWFEDQLAAATIEDYRHQLGRGN